MHASFSDAHTSAGGSGTIWVTKTWSDAKDIEDHAVPVVPAGGPSGDVVLLGSFRFLLPTLSSAEIAIAPNQAHAALSGALVRFA